MKYFKYIFLALSVAAASVSCLNNSFYEVNVTSYCDFEYYNAIEAFGEDSLYVENMFEGGPSSAYLIFASDRSGSGAAMTGGFGMTMKVDTLEISETNKYPWYTRYGTRSNYGSNRVSAVFMQNPDETLMPEHDIVFSDPDYGTCTPAYCQINNTQQTVAYIYSDDPARRFTEGDYLKLTFTGYNAGEKTGSVEYYLADFRIPEDGGAAPDSVVTTWKTVALSGLGDIDYVDLDIESSKVNFPAFVCLDNFSAAIYIKR